MHGSLGPGEQPNKPIMVHMVTGKDKVSFGFSGMRKKDGRVTALFNVARSGHRWVKVEQIAPYEWHEVAQPRADSRESEN